MNMSRLYIVTCLFNLYTELLLLFSCSVMSDLCNPMDCSTPGFPIPHHLQSLLNLMSIESVMPSSYLVLCHHPLLFLPSIFLSIKVFSNELALTIRWPKYWSFSFSISPSSEHPGLISFRMDWLDLLAVQGTLKSLLQHHSSKASIHWHSAFFMVQLSHLYMTTGKNIAFTMQLLGARAAAAWRWSGSLLRGDTPCPRSEAANVRRYHRTKVRSSS